MGDRPKADAPPSALHRSLLHRATGSLRLAADSLVYSYHRSFNGFAAKLTESQKDKLAGYKDVVSVFPSEMKKLHTTRSWDYLGFPQNVTRATVESDIIIGMLDTGIWPESQSFNDSGYGPPPKKWKGTCQSSSNFTCNKDSIGHGTHTASTAAGSTVTPASLLGIASGTARGGVPSARIAVYKICWAGGCSDADILAAFDDAIADGVDVISLSVGGSAKDYFEDSIAIGAFHSMKNGILTSNSAGNEGPGLKTISNCSPWSLSVAASSTDRKFETNVKLGNGKVITGNSLNTFEPGQKMYPIIYGRDAPNKTAGGSLDKDLVKGKIVYCDDATASGLGQIDAGAVGSIMKSSSPYGELESPFPLPVSLMGAATGDKVLEYINSTKNPTAVITKTTDSTDSNSSSRHPDLTAPGLNILAAWTQANPLTDQPGETRIVPYNIISGTSMSCPHVSGAAAYVKTFHPTWSPAAIKSALMTTSRSLTVKDNADAEFAYGSGQIDPSRAVDPGLVYDAGESDYVKLLCGQGYTTKQLRLVTGDESVCSSTTNGTVWDLNYPSFALSSSTPANSVTRVFRRTVTNVGKAVSSYKATVNGPSGPSGLKVEVVPDVLNFKSVGEKQEFVVTVTAGLGIVTLSGSLVWSDGSHVMFIVYMGDRPHNIETPTAAASAVHISLLHKVTGSVSLASESLVYSYSKSFNGFAAKLTKAESEKLSGHESVVSVFPNRLRQLHTTRSWDFIGFPQNVTRTTVESDVIIGMLDSGIWPESQSFNDSGKIIGARFYHAGEDFKNGEIPSPRDSDGHGTHTASTAAGNTVTPASLFGLASGTARGGVPSARIAVYKICWEDGCSDADILAAFDDAIADGVDIISLSVGGSLNKTLVQGKIVVCNGVNQGTEQVRVGAAGSTMIPPPKTVNLREVAYPFPLPVSILTHADGVDLLEYINSTRYPDLTAPGVDILAAWSEATTITGQNGDTRIVPYNIISGTSMSCPHASAAAAYVKSFHPAWSPAAIKSALMTTARQLSVEDNSDAEFAYGSGQIDPIKAVDPGLVYDAGEIDYVRMLCGQGYNLTQLRLVTGDQSTVCSGTTRTVGDLNYPSFALSYDKPTSITRLFRRTVTNVGPAPTTYKVFIDVPEELEIRVEPEVLFFNETGEKQSFVVIVTAALETSMLSGSFILSNGIHLVRSPVVAFVSGQEDI
ncbi:unnamed protein product [Linum tenue]|uniref:Cucumisin n=1 Tax=Linum tenue TaxID=586396 RepID=A0AAV0JT75_9ROSI|nr:unnamed protein product [Linum tenue]